MTYTLPSIDPATTTLQAIKEHIQSYLGGSSVVASVDKVKLLLNKKPIGSSKKTVSEALEGSETGTQVELGVMVMGGAPDPPPQAHPVPQAGFAAAVSAPESEKAALEADEKKATDATPMEGVETSGRTPVQPGEGRGKAVLETSEFWDDLQGFLQQRIRSSEDAVKLRAVFERAWKSSTAAP
jgi:ubiquitin-like protein 4